MKECRTCSGGFPNDAPSVYCGASCRDEHAGHGMTRAALLSLSGADVLALGFKGGGQLRLAADALGPGDRFVPPSAWGGSTHVHRNAGFSARPFTLPDEPDAPAKPKRAPLPVPAPRTQMQMLGDLLRNACGPPSDDCLDLREALPTMAEVAQTKGLRRLAEADREVFLATPARDMVTAGDRKADMARKYDDGHGKAAAALRAVGLDPSCFL